MTTVHVLKGVVASVSKHANTILSTIRENWAKSDIMSLVQELSEIPLRTQDIGRSINVIDNALQDWNRMKFTRRDSVLRKGYSSVKEAGKKRYATVIESDVIDLRTGEKETRYTRIYHDVQELRGDLELEAETILVESEVSPWLEVTGQRPVQGFVFK